MTDITLNRRSAIQGLLAISTAGALAACGSPSPEKPKSQSISETPTGAKLPFFTKSEMAMLAALADTIIPTTDTPGAVAAGVPETLQGLATEWADDNHRTYWRAGLVSLNKTLPDFVVLDAQAREDVLAPYDANVFDGKTEDRFYRDLKSTIATAYYMSEPGASEELAYDPVPGAWKGCVPLADYPKAWAT